MTRGASPRAAGTALVLLRHGPTDWTAARRIQGRSDRPLSPYGRERVRRWRLPSAFHAYDWVSSPLRRARETAALLGHGEAAVVEALIEASWGDWEGARLSDLRARLGGRLAAMEARGLDFRPPNGESPREVQARLRPWLGELAGRGRPVVAVCHKGVIRALYALASGWDMREDPPTKIRTDCAHRLRLGPGGRIEVERMNLRLLR